LLTAGHVYYLYQALNRTPGRSVITVTGCGPGDRHFSLQLCFQTGSGDCPQLPLV